MGSRAADCVRWSAWPARADAAAVACAAAGGETTHGRPPTLNFSAACGDPRTFACDRVEAADATRDSGLSARICIDGAA